MSILHKWLYWHSYILVHYYILNIRNICYIQYNRYVIDNSLPQRNLRKRREAGRIRRSCLRWNSTCAIVWDINHQRLSKIKAGQYHFSNARHPHGRNNGKLPVSHGRRKGTIAFPMVLEVHLMTMGLKIFIKNIPGKSYGRIALGQTLLSPPPPSRSLIT